ncbi:MAG: nicotinamidase [bacterium]|nr:nicotinamidase [bacterium]
MTTTTATRFATPWRAPTPSFFNPDNASRWDHGPDLQALFTEALDWRKSVRSATSDRKRVCLLPIDMQKDFCFPEGTLYVGGRSGTGAIDDSRRLAEFIYRNLGVITAIRPSFDTHLSVQIFFPTFFNTADGKPVAPHTDITHQSLLKGEFSVSPAAAAALGLDYNWLCQYALHYTSELEKPNPQTGQKYCLRIWPFHCMLGMPGHSLVGVVEEAAMFHAFVRGTQLHPEVKGGNPLTENYSILRPEVLLAHDGQVIAQKNTKVIQTLLNYDYVFILGQAASHCVKSTIDDLLYEIMQKDPALARKVYVMADCMSAVAVPDGKGGFYADFTDEATAALKRFADAGMHVVKSTDSLDSWPDLVL